MTQSHTEYNCTFVKVKTSTAPGTVLFSSSGSLRDEKSHRIHNSKYISCSYKISDKANSFALTGNFNTLICQNKQYESFLSLHEVWEISSLWMRNESWRCISGTGYLLHRVMARPSAVIPQMHFSFRIMSASRSKHENLITVCRWWIIKKMYSFVHYTLWIQHQHKHARPLHVVDIALGLGLGWIRLYWQRRCIGDRELKGHTSCHNASFVSYTLHVVRVTPFTAFTVIFPRGRLLFSCKKMFFKSADLLF